MYLEAYKIFKANGYAPTCHNRFSRLAKDKGNVSAEVVGSGAGFFMGHIDSFQYSDLADVKDYVSAVQNGTFPFGSLSALSRQEQMRKAMMLIYVRVPVNRARFRSQFGLFPEEAFPDAIRNLKQKGLIEENNGGFQLSEKGDPWRFNIAWEF